MPQPALNPDRPVAEWLRNVPDYDLAATLGGGQAFGWRWLDGGWEAVLGGHWVRVEAEGSAWRIRSVEPGPDPAWLTHYFAWDEDLEGIRRTFPSDAPMQAAVAACPGLRLLRQDPWECLAGFICSSTKQVVQIQQMVALLAERLGEPVAVPPGHAPVWAFPSPDRVAAAGELALRACKLGFRAPYLAQTAQRVATGELDLEALRHCGETMARERLMVLPGVGRKVADCVLLFAYSYPRAFPVDVWVTKALRRLYFPRARKVTPQRLLDFSARHFGPHGGYAQQYLFHYVRTHLGRRWSAD